MVAEFRSFGPPGTGKTTRLATRDIPRAVAKYGADKIMVVSFTKTAAMKIASAKSLETGESIGLPEANVGTLHSICFHALNAPKIIETEKQFIRDWNEKYEHWAITGSLVSVLDEVCDEFTGAGGGDKLLNVVNIFRNKLIDERYWQAKVVNFYKAWCEFKQVCGAYDFTDLISVAFDTRPYAPMRPAVIFVDECQDFSLLQLKLVRSWAEDCEWIILVGDDDQCQPRGTRVLTTNGYKNIEMLDPKTDELSAYSRQDSAVFLGIRKTGYKFDISHRYVDETIYKITCDNKTTHATDNHLWLVKWAETARNSDITVVYLMQKDGYYRVGWCQLIRADGCFHVGVRALAEGAEQTWILHAFDSKAKASMFESYYAAEFGIPTVMFKQVQNNYLYTQPFINKFWKMFDRKKLKQRALKLLSHCNLNPAYPFFTKAMARTRRGGKTIMKVATINLLPGLMLLPSHQKGRNVKWKHFKRFELPYKGDVYSLDVKKYHTYIADGLVTHNCIFSFSGATPDAFLEPPVEDKMKTVLKQSYRVPQKILDRATRLIEKVVTREPKTYAARLDKNGVTAQGRVREHSANWKHPEELVADCKQYVDQNKSIMFLASCSYMLDPLKAVLKNQGLTFHNPYRTKRYDWNPLGTSGNGVSATELLTSFLAVGIDENYWNVPDFIRWAKFLRVDSSALRRKYGKAGLKALAAACEDNADGLHTTRNIVADILDVDAIEPALARDIGWLAENLTPKRRPGLNYPITVLKRFGVEALSRRPQILIGTVHSVKGEESEITYLFPDLSWQAHDEMNRNQAGRESIYRVFYVGMTRASEELIICAPATLGGHAQKPKLFINL